MERSNIEYLQRVQDAARRRHEVVTIYERLRALEQRAERAEKALLDLTLAIGDANKAITQLRGVR